MKGVSSVDRKEAGVKAGSDMVADQAVSPLGHQTPHFILQATGVCACV